VASEGWFFLVFHFHFYFYFFVQLIDTLGIFDACL